MRRLLLLGAVGVAGFAVAFAAHGIGKLTIGGKTVDTTFIVQDGRTYVPLADVAKALGTTVQKSDGGFTLAELGAGSMVTGLEGKVGQTMKTPELQFSVQSVTSADHYKRKYSDGALDAFDANIRLVVVMCRVRNATSKTIGICTVGGSKGRPRRSGRAHVRGVYGRRPEERRHSSRFRGRLRPCFSGAEVREAQSPRVSNGWLPKGRSIPGFVGRCGCRRLKGSPLPAIWVRL